MKNIRSEFKIINRKENVSIYLDNASTTHKPELVIRAISNFYESANANVHRGAHACSWKASALYEQARQTAARFIHAHSAQELVFLRGTTEAINLVATCFVEPAINSGDKILISRMEHHSNILPWLHLCKKVGAELLWCDITEKGEIDMIDFERKIKTGVRFCAVTHVSNVLGTINPVKQMIAMCHQYEIPVLVDGAQAIAQIEVDVTDLDCDFYCFSGHKMYGPTGIGCLYVKEKYLASMPPFQFGGSMVSMVSEVDYQYLHGPARFEAGTPNIAGAIGLASAIQFIDDYAVRTTLSGSQLVHYVADQFRQYRDIQLYGDTKNKTGIFSFTVKNWYSHDLAHILSEQNICIRAGHHCAMPLMARLQVEGTLRMSLACYTSKEDIDALFQCFHQVGIS